MARGLRGRMAVEGHPEGAAGIVNLYVGRRHVAVGVVDGKSWRRIIHVEDVGRHEVPRASGVLGGGQPD